MLWVGFILGVGVGMCIAFAVVLLDLRRGGVWKVTKDAKTKYTKTEETGSPKGMPDCNLSVPANYTGIIGKDDARCPACGKLVEIMYYCPCTDTNCCVWFCQTCRDKLHHTHNTASHYLMARQAAHKRQEIIKRTSIHPLYPEYEKGG